MAILLALCSAVAWGLSDFVAGLTSRRTTGWAVAFVSNTTASACTVALAFTASGSPSTASFAWATLAGIGEGLGTGFLYRGFATGRISLVAPVSAVSAAVLPVLVGAASGERPGLLVWLGITAAMPGIWLVSGAADPAEPAEPGGLGRALPPGLVDALLAGLGFGIMFTGLGQVPAHAGLWPLAVSQIVTVPAAILLAVVLRSAWVPRSRPAWWAVLAGLLAGAGTFTFLLATQRGYLTVAAVLSSLYPATTVLRAALVLRERINRGQGLGLWFCALAVALVAAG
ncbi:MAG: EamA family transporter [Nocardioidaceae bacterium]